MTNSTPTDAAAQTVAARGGILSTLSGALSSGLSSFASLYGTAAAAKLTGINTSNDKATLDAETAKLIATQAQSRQDTMRVVMVTAGVVAVGLIALTFVMRRK